MIQQPLGVIAGSGRFPLLVLQEARRRQLRTVIAAIREEASPELQHWADQDPQATLCWIGLGQLGKLLDLFQRETVTQAVMAGQVKHSKIFAPGSQRGRRLLSALPDRRMLKLLMALPRRDTESLIGAVVAELEREGVRLLDSTLLLEDLVPAAGILTRRRPNTSEKKDFDYGRPLASQLMRLGLGQSIVVKDQAVVAVEAMEGTDQAIRRASRLVDGQPVTVIKAGRPRGDLRFDVPVLGLDSLAVFQECNVSAVAIDADRTLLLDRSSLISQADEMGLTMVAFPALDDEPCK